MSTKFRGVVDRNGEKCYNKMVSYNRKIVMKSVF